ncbi:MAG: Uma2 family endonuclease [Deltaproteobacteria bacterium]|nr:Uma2 family endonuclease [Deltaproteobacteria bacterium]
MTAAVSLPTIASPDQDQRVTLRGMSWWQFETILAARGDAPVPRIAYMNGVIELMSPSRRHEGTKSILGMLIEAYCFAKGIYFDPIASTTLKNPALERGAEPDESYAFSKGREVPDLAIEVIYTSGNLDKLELYRGLGVREVWFWVEDRLLGYVLQDGAYVQVEQSAVLPGLRLDTLTPYVGQDDRFEAVQAFRRGLA